MSGAEVLLRRAVTVDPNEVDCRKRLAAFYQGVGQLPKALAQCECVARLEPNDPTCQMLIGSLALRLKQPARAEAAFERIMVLAPDQSIGYRELARLYLGTGRKTAEARTLAEKAVALEPIAPNYSLLSQACYQAGDIEGALAAMGKAVQLDPGNSRYQQAYNTMKARR
jgi:predicted Zn-dependent protease